MINNNICILSTSNDPKSVIINNIMETYKPQIDLAQISTFLETTENYFSLNVTNNHINFFNTQLINNVETNLNKELEENIRIINRCSSIIILLDCNNYKDGLIEQYYYIIYTYGIENIAFIIYNLQHYPSNDRNIRLKECHNYLTKITKRIGIKTIKIMNIDHFDFTPLLLNKLDIKQSNYNSMIVSNKFNYNKTYDVLNGTINSGSIKTNDVLCIKPDNIIVNIKKIEIDHKEVDNANMYDMVGILIDKNDNVKNGDLLVNFNSEIKKTNRLLCKIIVIEDMISVNDNLVMHYNQNKIDCDVSCIYKNLRLHISNKDSLPLSIKKCKVGIICVELSSNIYINKFNDETKEGRVLFTNGDNKLSCIGIIKVIK